MRGFAVVHCLGILTSMFSAVTVSRAMVNLFGHRRRVAKLAIGDTAWKSQKNRGRARFPMAGAEITKSGSDPILPVEVN